MKKSAHPVDEDVHKEMKQMVTERDEALLSLDMEKIKAYGTKYGARFSDDHDTFWTSVHMARSAAKTLPMEARKISKRWLLARGFRSLDDGDVKV